jgi:hypothetical protein
MAEEKFDTYTRLMGGKRNLPPKIPTSPPSLQPPATSSDQSLTEPEDEEANPGKIVDAFGNLQTYDDFVTAHPFPAPSAPAYDNRHAGKPQPNNPSSHANRSTASEADVDSDFTLDPRKDGPSELGMSFCPFLAITKFPYKYADSALRQPIATAFFDGGKIYNRSWDL